MLGNVPFGGNSAPGAWAAGAEASGDSESKDGKMLVEAFIKAFNAMVAQRSPLQSAIAGR